MTSNNELKGISQEVLDFANEAAMNEAANFIRPSVEEVRQAATNLINVAKNLKAKNGSVLEQIGSLNYENESAMLNFSKKFITSQQDYLDIMEKVYDFQNIINEFLGQKVLMTYVAISPTTGKVNLYGFEADISHIRPEEAAKSKSKNDDPNIVGRYSQQGVIKRNSVELINTRYAEKGKKTLDDTFQETWQRFRISKAKYKMGGAGYILWKEKNGWDGRKVSGAGPLGEAYVAFFINEYIFPKQIEKAVKTFILDDKMGVAAVDNASGLLKGDVSKGIYQLGVKAKGAQALGYTEIIRYAEEMLKDNHTERYLKDLKERLDKGTPNAVQKLAEFQWNEIEGPNGLITEMDKRIEKIGKTFGDSISIYKR